jgi:hypothetical protein
MGRIGIVLFSLFNLGCRWGGGQHHALTVLPPGKIRYPLYRRLGGSQGRSGPVRKISPPTGFDPRTVHPVASRCTDCAIQAAMCVIFIVFSSVRIKIQRLHLRTCDFIPPIYCYERGPTIFQNTRNYLKIPIARRVTRSKFHTEDPYMLVATAQYFTCPEFAHCISVVIKIFVWWIMTINLTCRPIYNLCSPEYCFISSTSLLRYSFSSSFRCTVVANTDLGDSHFQYP